MTKVLGNLLAMLLVTAAASATLWPSYQSRAFIVMVAGGFVLGATVAILGARFRWPAWLVILVTILGFGVVGVPLAVPARAVNGVLPTVEGVQELAMAVVLGWKQLVTIALPVGDYQALLVPALILVLVSTVIGLTVALRSAHGELAVLAPVGLFIAGIALGPSSVARPVELGLGFLVLLLSWLLWFRWRRRVGATRLVAAQSARTIESLSDRRLAAARRLVSAAAIIALAIAAGTAASLAVPPAGARDVVRSHVQQPFNPNDYASPLSGFRSYLQSPTVDDTLLRVTGLPTGERLRLATLDSYDGVVFAAGGEAGAARSETGSADSGSFTRLPYRLDQSAVDGQEVVLQVEVLGYTGVWVPGAGQLEQVVFGGDTAVARSDSFYYNDVGGSAAVIGGLTRGDRYESRSVVPESTGDLATALPGSAVLAPIAVPDGMLAALEEAQQAGDTPGEQLQAMLDDLLTRGYISHGVGTDEPVSRSGHGADRMTQLFTDVPMLGDEEQYAVAAAILARSLGFPARVVLGFAPDAAADPEGAVAVTGADVTAWIEVQTALDGWVMIDPNPAFREVPAKQPDDPSVVSRPQSVLPPPVVDIEDPRDTPPPDTTVEDPPAPIDPLLALLFAVLQIVGWSGLALLVLLSPLLVVVAIKTRRRYLRRSRGTAGERIGGGWREFADTVTDFNGVAAVGTTRAELAASVGGTPALGGTPPVVFAELVDRAVFAPDTPSNADADRVWASVGALRRSLAVEHTRRDRLRALLSLRSLGRYAGGKKPSRSEGAR
ncbi:transglutaminase-like domain-containing protein [Cryobacterium frigoriphilum]|nr:transglutaminase-like domain-containing protein [Cryobacterium frigoriphilum]